MQRMNITLVDAEDEYCDTKIERSLYRPLLISTHAEEVVLENVTIQNNVEDFYFASDESSHEDMAYYPSNDHSFDSSDSF